MSELARIKKHAAGIDLGTKDFFVSVIGDCNLFVVWDLELRIFYFWSAVSGC